MIENSIDVFKAILNGDITKIKQALINGENVNITRVIDANQSMLHYATNDKNTELIKLLIEHKININIKDEYGTTALHKAAKKGFISIVKMLIENGALVDIKDNKKVTPFNDAIYNNEIECAEFLLKNGANIDNKYDSNYVKGITSLLFAVEDSFVYSKKLVEFLTANGANPDIKDSKDNLLLTSAVEQNTLTDELVKATSNINIQDKDGKTVLHHAAASDSINPLKKLVKHDSLDFKILDNDGKVPLYYSINEARAAFFIKNGAAYDKTNEYSDLFRSLYGEQHIDLEKLNKLIDSGEEEKFEIPKLTNQLKNAIKDFAKKHQNETFYILTIEGNSISLNSEEAFKKTLKEYQNKYPEFYNEKDAIENLKFNTGDFKYQGVCFLQEGYIHHYYEEHCSLPDEEQNTSEYTIAMETLLKELQDKDTFKPLKISRDFKATQVAHTY
ncbi:hypothetical protein CXF68_13190 [Tenacibaculum sp. Bg11-29]|uniref:ankyrin repeat domain-containing protein n=1 Tax=Tenacibaculum sp. Bg11-29 TaxID=2058306 RepID=UPI000C345691|nr:ankyrin repeat domain-containing protein [Tenacibaculum sp. Bg11-29]PKH51580.1 hypothetical protein CXF68_13190 [Tenacibaculum sp. Bg11-29]